LIGSFWSVKASWSLLYSWFFFMDISKYVLGKGQCHSTIAAASAVVEVQKSKFILKHLGVN